MWTWPAGADADDARRSLRVLSVPINWKDGVLESLVWGTEVFSSEIGAEQRRGYRRFPRRSFEASFLRQNGHRSRLDNFLTSVGNGLFLYPLWHEAVTLDTSYTSDGTVTFEEGTLAVREFRLDDLVLVMMGDPNQYDVLTVTAVDLDTDTITMAGVTEVGPWKPGARIIPLRTARILDMTKLSNVTDRVATLTLRATLSSPDEQFPASWGYCAPLWRWKPDRSESIDMDYMRSNFMLDFDSGVIEVTDPGNRAQVVQSMQMKFFGRANLADFRAFLYNARGKAVRFYVPTFQDDVQLLKPAFGSTFDARVTGFSEYQDVPQEARQMIAVVFRDRRPTIYRTITGVTPILDSVAPFRQIGERFSVGMDMPPIDPLEVERISFVVPSRFDSDQIDIKHHVAGSYAASVGVTTRSQIVDGMPPIECWVTSLTYPIEVVESLTAVAEFTAGRFYDPNQQIGDDLTSNVALISGDLRNVLRATEYLDQLSSTVVLLSGDHRNILRAYDDGVESISSTVTLTAGTHKALLISHTIAAESIKATAIFTEGTLS